MAHLFFDLDGTLTDSAPGITRSLAHAIEGLGRPAPDPASLVHWIGSSLPDIFAGVLGTEDVTTLERAIGLYVERFEDIGIRENALFPGVRDGIEALRAAGHVLHLVTAKKQPQAERVLELFDLAPHFAAVHGTPRERGADKVATLAKGLAAAAADASTCLMIGDRRHDVEAAHRNAVRSVWVEWGYGSDEERDAVAPHHVVERFGQIAELAAP